MCGDDMHDDAASDGHVTSAEMSSLALDSCNSGTFGGGVAWRLVSSATADVQVAIEYSNCTGCSTGRGSGTDVNNGGGGFGWTHCLPEGTAEKPAVHHCTFTSCQASGEGVIYQQGGHYGGNPSIGIVGSLIFADN
jgi:hypothetical protein